MILLESGRKIEFRSLGREMIWPDRNEKEVMKERGWGVEINVRSIVSISDGWDLQG